MKWPAAAAAAAAAAATGARLRPEAFGQWIALPFQMRVTEHYGTTWKHAGGYVSCTACLRARSVYQFSACVEKSDAALLWLLGVWHGSISRAASVRLV